ncbi:hypothetical protein O4H26_00690 [Aequorivita viscosa]|nr:hypothetical protein [Aequorivita viscosa]
MRLPFSILCSAALLFAGCKSNFFQKDKTTVHTSSHQESSSKIEGFLLEESFDIISNYSSIEIFGILKKPIDEEPGKFSNQLVFQRKLTDTEAQKLVKNLLYDSNYLWSSYNDNPDLSPSKQIIIKDGQNQINILFDRNLAYVTFINLNGASVLKIKNPLKSLLMNL